MKKLILLAVVCLCIVTGAPAASAAEDVVKQPLNEVFDRLVIVPYDYQGKAFMNGQLTDIHGDYEMVQREDRVLVPIRLMSDLATQADKDGGRWEARWLPEEPDVVRLIQYNSNRTVTFTVNSHTMLVNDEAQLLDIAPQKINGRIMLPLRSAAEALNKHIDWLDGLILIGDDYVDLQHAQTTALVDTVKKQLADPRGRIDYERVLEPVAQYGDTVYYLKTVSESEHSRKQLYAKQPGGKEAPITLTGEPMLEYSKTLDDALYYMTAVDGQTELHVHSFADGSSRRVSDAGEWRPGDGWLTSIEELDGELYVTLHTGDLTMGRDTLYRVEDGTLQEVAGAKSFIRLIKDGDRLFFTDFKFMADLADNLMQVDLKTGETAQIGVEGYAYGANRTVGDNGSIGYTGDRALYVRDGYLYALGYNVGDLQDKSAVYKLNLADQTQVKLTPPADQFWIAGDELYYRDSATGYLAVTDLNGNGQSTLTERPILNAQLIDGSIYYTSNAERDAYQPGVLYRHDLTTGQDIRLSDLAASSYFKGESGPVYYVSHSYAPGIYKIGEDGRHVHLASDFIDSAILTEEGLVYTLKYAEGIYAAE